MTPRWGVAVVPSPMTLLPDAVGRVDVAADLRAASVDAVRDVLASAGPRVVVVAATDRPPSHRSVPLAVRVAGHVLALAGADGRPVEHVVVPHGATPAECHAAGTALAQGDPAAVVVVADGSGRRHEDAPGRLDPRAHGVDESVLDALRDGDGHALGALDPQVGAEILFDGRAALQVLGALLEAVPMVGTIDRVEDPFWVRYVVARLAPR